MPSTVTRENWAGKVNGGGFDFTAAQVNWTMPSVTAGCGGGTLAIWAGLGGYNHEGLLQAGFNGPANQYPWMGWFDYLDAAHPSNGEVSTWVTIAPGQGGYAYADYDPNKGWAHFVTTNTSTGVSSGVKVKALGTSFYDSSSAEYIAERLKVVQGGSVKISPLAKHSYVNYSLAQGRDVYGGWHGGQTLYNDTVDMTDAFLNPLENATGWTSSSAFATHWAGCQ